MSQELILAKEEYVRDLDFVKYYHRDATKFLQRMRGITTKEASDFIRNLTSPQGKYPFKDPLVYFLDSKDEGNRVQKTSTIGQYMRDVSANRYIMACTFTCYNHPDDKLSPTAEYVLTEIEHRNHNKGEMKKALTAGDSKKAGMYNNRQNRNKIKVNSISGSHGTTSSVLYRKSAHSTLTTTCRSGTQNTNALLEKFLTGNRHYYSSEVTLNNIISIINITDLDLVEKAMEHYQLIYPTADYVCKYILRSTSLYWTSPIETKLIDELIHSLEPVELAAYLYVSDLNALRDLNPQFVRDMIDSLHKPDYVGKVDDPGEWLGKLSGDDRALLGIIANQELCGRSQKDPEVLGDSKIYGVLGATAKRICGTIDGIHLLARAFWMTKNMPPSVAHFPDSVRRCVIASDTDSSIFTNQHWTEWFAGKVAFDHESSSVAAVTTYLSSLLTEHTLMMQMSNFGSAKQHLTEFQMKNEYAFPFFSLTTMAKHYFAAMASKEGVVFKDYKWEIKGAQLKNSNAKVELVERAEEVTKELALTIMEGKKIDALGYLKEFSDLEKGVIQQIKAGDVNIFSRARIKPRDSYSETASHSPYDHYDLWQNVFAPKYGDASAPPYSAIRVNIEAGTKTKFNEWLMSIEDQELASRFAKWMNSRGKQQMQSMLLPVDIISGKGIPKEIVSAMDIRTMTMKQMRTFYLLAETFCFFTLNKNNTRMLSDDI